MDQPTIHIDAHSCVSYDPLKSVVYISQHSHSPINCELSFVVYAYKCVQSDNDSGYSLQLQSEAVLSKKCTALAPSNDGSVVAVGDDEKVTLWRSSELFKKEEAVRHHHVLLMISNRLNWCSLRERAPL